MVQHTFPRYYLTTDTFHCRIDDHLVFLNLQDDKYLCLPPHMTGVVESLLSGEVTPSGARGKSKDPATLPEIIDELTTNRLMTANPADGKAPSAPRLETVSRDLDGYVYGKKPHITARVVFTFFKSALVTLFRLHVYPLKKSVQALARRKRQLKPGARDYDWTQIRDLVESFKILQPLFFKARNHCLFDSFALMEFLACHGIVTQIVFAVKMRPFTAHCWVQKDDIVFNDSTDHANLFTPIMTI